MSNFVLYSLIGSVVLTLIVNVLPMLFPGAAERVRRKVFESVQAHQRKRANGEAPRVQVFFPWKWMLLASIVLTIVMNVVAGLAGY
jgi:hypothetical protein